MYRQFELLSNQYLFRIRFNGQACYLQKILNIRFDSTLERIRIVDTVEKRRFIYDFSIPPGRNRIWSMWDRERIYQVGQFASDGGYLFEAIGVNQNKRPKTSIQNGEGYWKYSDKTRYVARSTKMGSTARYIIFVPKSLVYDNNEFLGVLNYYRVYGLSYSIQTY